MLEPSSSVDFGLRRSGLVALGLWSTLLMGQICKGKPPSTLQGKLLSSAGTGLILRTPKRDYPLSGETPYLFHTLQDTRLSGREVRLEGIEKSDGTFEVRRLYTVREGKLYTVRYYCEVCHIEALEPGNCVCCQQPTELQELPLPGPDKQDLKARRQASRNGAALPAGRGVH